MTSRILRPVNALTLVRIPLAALLWGWPHAPLFLLGVMALAAFSDVIDGAVARRLDPSVRHDPHNPGAWLDPLCDKIFVISLVVLVAVHYTPPLHLALLLLVRELLLLPLLIGWALWWRPRGKRVDFRAVWAGKATTVVQFIAVGSMLFLPDALIVLAPPAAALGALSVILVVRRALRRGAGPPGVSPRGAPPS